MPSEFGRVIYQIPGRHDRQIFIVGQSHRSPVSGRERPDTLRIQTEIYRIGEWLIREGQVALLLPEGFFCSTSVTAPPAGKPRSDIHLDNQTLAAKLSDPRRFPNAGLLLNACYHTPLGQVEDEGLYQKIHHLLEEAQASDNPWLPFEIQALQEKRTTTMLEKIPEVVEQAYRDDRIANHRAMFTIGLAHLREILSLLRSGALPPAGGNEISGNTVLKLIEQGYGVTIVLPNSLAENQQLLRLSQLAGQ